MKKALGFESLEGRRVLSAWTVEILDQKNLVPTQVESQMRSAANYVMGLFNRHITWRGTLDIRLDVQSPMAPHDGFTPAILQVVPGGKNATISEMQTGVDIYPNYPDAGMVVYLGNDGTVKLYGMKVYFDPNPMEFVQANVPQGHFDFIGVLTHEIAHGLGFQWGTTDFAKFGTKIGDYSYFNGPETVKTLGRPLPMTANGSGTHYGNSRLADNPFKMGLMYEWGNYAGNRLDIGRLDLAVFRDLGLATKNLEGLPLVDRIDSQAPRLTASRYDLNENLPAGTTVATLGTNLGLDYTFQIVSGWDSRSFRISGTTLVAGESFDYESKSSYTIYVRTTDRHGVWVYSRMDIRVNNVQESPSLQVPVSLWVQNGAVSMESLKAFGDSNYTFGVVFFSRNAIFESAVNDPEVRVFVVRNIFGGTTLSMNGTAAALSRNFRKIVYRGSESSINVQVGCNGRNCGSANISLRYS